MTRFRLVESSIHTEVNKLSPCEEEGLAGPELFLQELHRLIPIRANNRYFIEKG